jgi:hypothetical protein
VIQKFKVKSFDSFNDNEYNIILFKSVLRYLREMSTKKNENNNNGESQSKPAGSLIHRFENAERLKAEAEEKERQKALFAKKMAKFAEDKGDELKSDTAVNEKAKMFVDIANKDPEKERAEREKKIAFEKKKLGFQEGAIANDDNASKSSGAEIKKKREIFTGPGTLDEEAQRKKNEEEELKQQRKREFEKKSTMFNQSNE